MSHQYPRQSEQHEAMQRIGNTLASGTKSRHLCDCRIFILWLSQQVKFIFSLYRDMVAETSCFVILNFHLLERKGVDCGAGGGGVSISRIMRGVDYDMIGCGAPTPSFVVREQSPCRNMKNG